MKKIVAVILGIVLCLAVVGCGNNNVDTSVSTAPSVQTVAPTTQSGSDQGVLLKEVNITFYEDNSVSGGIFESDDGTTQTSLVCSFDGNDIRKEFICFLFLYDAISTDLASIAIQSGDDIAMYTYKNGQWNADLVMKKYTKFSENGEELLIDSDETWAMPLMNEVKKQLSADV